MKRRFNSRPVDFIGHSLSGSNVLVLKQNGAVTSHYVDSVGFKEIPDFMPPDNYLKTAEMTVEEDYGMIDCIINNGPRLTHVTGRGDPAEQKPSLLEKLRQPIPERKSSTPPHIRGEKEI